MSDAKARVQHLEEIVRAPRCDLSAAQAWTAIGSLEGNPDLVEKACRLAVPKARLAGLAVPNWMHRAPVRALAEIAYPPGEPVPEVLLKYQRRRRFDPEGWRRYSRGHADDHLLEYNNSYCSSLLAEVTFVISPDPGAIHLRHELHSGTPPRWAKPPDLTKLSLEKWPEGVFLLVSRGYGPNLLREKVDIAGHSWTPRAPPAACEACQP
jgi:hypothetical protein